MLEIGASAFEGCALKSVTIPSSVKKVLHQAFSGCTEITVYDSIDPTAKSCYAGIDLLNGHPNSEVGYIGIGPAWAMWECAANHAWYDYTIIVRSAQTGAIKYVVEMNSDPKNRQYYCLLCSGWGKNATFAFRELDKFFPKIEGATRKQRVALLRLQYGVDLDEETREYYRKYVSRSAKDILRMCIQEERMDWVKICEEAGALRKDAVEYAIKQAAEAKKPDFTAFFLDYQSKHFPLKAGKDNAGLRLPDLPREKKKKTADKTSEESI